MNRHRITLTVETDRAVLIDQLRLLTDAIYVDARFDIVIDDLGNDEAQPDAQPSFGGRVRDAGGGVVEILLDRDVEEYPETRRAVIVTYATDGDS